MRFDKVLPAAVLLLTTTAPRLAAQRPSAQVMVGAGSATDVRGIASSAWTVAPSLALGSRSTLFRLGASGAGFSGGGWAVGGTTGLDLRAPIGRAAGLGLSTAASATTTSYRSSYGTVSAVPSLELRLAPAVIFGGVRLATACSSLGAVATPAGPFALPATRSVSRSAIGPVFGGRLDLASWRAGSVTLRVRQESVRVDTVRTTDRTAALSVLDGPVSITGTIGARAERAMVAAFGGVRASLDLSRVLALQLGAERYPADRLTGALGGRAVSAGLVLRTAAGPRPLPSPSGVIAPAAGYTRLAIRAPRAATVEVAGDWNRWQPVAAHRGANGVWYADLAIPAGTWRYAFRVDRREWRVPDGAAATDDGFGGRSAWLTVDDDSR
ncbi:MAG: glycogen-binding domain-containing protein [Gemmatimonadales bacterium]